MELLEIEIHGFKSIEHLVFRPERLSVLISDFEYRFRLACAEGDKLVAVEEESRPRGHSDFTTGRSFSTLFYPYSHLVTHDFSPTHRTSRIRSRWL